MEACASFTSSGEEAGNSSDRREIRLTSEQPLTLHFLPSQNSKEQFHTLSDATITHSLDCQDQLQALLEALHLTYKLASLDITTYASTLASPPTCDNNDNDQHAADLQRRLDSLQKSWKLEETALPQLLQCIHGFQSRALQLDSESDRHRDKELEQRQQLIIAVQRVHQLEFAVKKIHQKYQTIKNKLQEKQKERKSLLKNVKDFIRHSNKKEEVEEQRVATQLRAHERLMKLDAALRKGSGNRSRHNSKEFRSRTSSRDSHTLDAMYTLDDDESVISSTSSVSSFQSYVTDDGVATLRLSPLIDQSIDQEYQEEILSFPRGSMIGLQFCTVPNAAKTRSKGKIDESLEEVERKDPTFKMPIFSNPFLKKDGADQSFLVCGRHGFDTTIGVPPANGLRLVAVNGETIEQGNWSLNKIRDIVSLDRAFTLTFRQDAAAQNQKERLDEAISTASLKHYSGGEDLQPDPLEILEEIELEGGKNNKSMMQSWIGGDKKENARLDSDGSMDDGTSSNRQRLPSWMKIEKEHSAQQMPKNSTSSTLPTPSSNSSSMKMNMIPAWMKGEASSATPTTETKKTYAALPTTAEEQATQTESRSQLAIPTAAISSNTTPFMKKSMLPSWMTGETTPSTPAETKRVPLEYNEESTKATTTSTDGKTQQGDNGQPSMTDLSSLNSFRTPSIKMPSLPGWMKGETTPTTPSETKKAHAEHFTGHASDAGTPVDNLTKHHVSGQLELTATEHSICNSTSTPSLKQPIISAWIKGETALAAPAETKRASSKQSGGLATVATEIPSGEQVIRADNNQSFAKETSSLNSISVPFMILPTTPVPCSETTNAVSDVSTGHDSAAETPADKHTKQGRSGQPASKEHLSFNSTSTPSLKMSLHSKWL